MGKCVIGEYYTFTILFTNNTGAAIDPDGTAITVFFFDEFNTKHIISQGAMSKIEVGRYIYRVLIPNTVKPQYQIYGTMTGEFVLAGLTVVQEETVDPFYPDSSDQPNNCPGVRVSFIKPR